MVRAFVARPLWNTALDSLFISLSYGDWRFWNPGFREKKLVIAKGRRQQVINRQTGRQTVCVEVTNRNGLFEQLA
jgi:hypothetical protein